MIDDEGFQDVRDVRSLEIGKVLERLIGEVEPKFPLKVMN